MAMEYRKMTKEDFEYLNQFEEEGIDVFEEYIGEYKIVADDERKMYYIYENGDGNKERGFPMYFSFVYNDKVGKIGYFIEKKFETRTETSIEVDCDVREYEYKAENEEEEKEVQKLIREAMEVYRTGKNRNGRREICNFYNFVEGGWGK